MHGSDVRLAQQWRPAHALMRAVLKAAAVRTAVSSWLAERATRLTGGLDVQIAPMPVDDRHFDAPNFDAVSSESPARDGILFVGRLNVQKGLAQLLDALAQQPLCNAWLDVVGDGPDKDTLHEYATMRGVSARIRWHGAQPASVLAAFYRRAVVVAMPSTEEGLGLVAVECGTPVVAYASGGLSDVVRSEWGGILVPCGDITALANALGNALTIGPHDERSRGKMREAMRERFAPSVVASRYLSLYAEAMHGSS